MRYRGVIAGVLVPALVMALAVGSAAPAIAAAPTVTLVAINNPQDDGGTVLGAVGVSGVAGGVDDGDNVYIEYRKPSGKWGRVGTAEVRGEGRYRTTLDSPVAGNAMLRARANVGGRSIVSKSVQVRLNKLFDLTVKNSAVSRGARDTTDSTRGGARYIELRSRAETTARVSWNLDGRCSELVGALRVVKTVAPGTGPISVGILTVVKGNKTLKLVNLTRGGEAYLRDTEVSRVGLLSFSTVFRASATDPRSIDQLAVLCSSTPPLDDFD